MSPHETLFLPSKSFHNVDTFVVMIHHRSIVSISNYHTSNVVVVSFDVSVTPSVYAHNYFTFYGTHDSHVNQMRRLAKGFGVCPL